VILADDCTGECLKSGPWGLAIILLLCVACYFLFRSMSKHVKKVREQAAKSAEPAATPPDPAQATPKTAENQDQSEDDKAEPK
jgi:hypothetical protein